MDGYDLFCVYQAVKLHFTSKSYNYFQYGGRTRCSLDSFDKRRDKYFFHNLSRKVKDDEVVEFLVSNFIEHENLWSKQLLSPEARTTYQTWKARVESLSYTFESDMNKLLEAGDGDINNAFKCVDGNHPIALVKFMQGEVSLESMVILNNLIQYLDKWDRMIRDDIIYPKIAMKIRKYGSFLHVDVDHMKKIAKKCLQTH